MSRSLVEVLERRAAERPDLPVLTFLIDGDELEVTLTWRQLQQRARSVGVMLREHGLEGSRAILLYPAGVDFVVAFLGCLYGGVTAVPVYPPEPARLEKTLPRLKAIMTDAAPGVILTTSFFLGFAEAILAMTPELADTPLLSTDDAADADERWAPLGTGPDDLALLQYTSGSTGTPRGVQLSHGNLLHNSRTICRAFEHTQDSHAVIWLPPYHDMGLIGGILQPLHEGFPVTLMSPMAFLSRPFLWLKAISRRRGTTSGGPNFAYELCARKVTDAEVATLDLSSWNVAFSGAEPTRADTVERFAARFAPAGFRRGAFFSCYGLAESTLYVTGAWLDRGARVQPVSKAALESGRYEPDGADARPLVSCGPPAPGHEVVIVDRVTGERAGGGQIGEVWVRSPSVARGYWRRDEENVAAFGAKLPDDPQPWLRTGDLGFLDAGELFLSGRSKDLIVVRGLNHFPQDLERTVEVAHRDVRPGCIAAFSIDHGDEERVVIAAEVQRSWAGGATIADDDPVLVAIRSALAADHGLQLHALALLTPGSIPKTSSGKIRRSATRAAFEAGTLDLRAAWREVIAAPSERAYVDLAEACRPIDRRSTKYQFDAEHDIAWDQVDAPGRFFSDELLAVFGFDAAALRGFPAANELLQWAMAITVCQEFIQLEEQVLLFTRDEADEIGGSRSIALLNDEEAKHIAVFRRYQEHLCAQRPAMAARVLAGLEAASADALWKVGHKAEHANPATWHFLIWMHILFTEEYTIFFHRALKGDIQPTWLSLHAAHRREEVQHVVTDFVHIQALRLTDAERRRWSAVFLDRIAEDFRRTAGFDVALQVVGEAHPGLPFTTPEALAERRRVGRRAAWRLLQHDGFDRTIRCAPAYAVFAARPDLSRPGARTPEEQAAAAAELLTWIQGWCATALSLPIDELTPDRSLAELGVDSLTGTELAVALSGRVGVQVTPGVLLDHPTLAGLADALAGGEA